MGVIANLVIRLRADSADLEKNLGKAERSLAKTGRNLERMGKDLTRGLTLPIVAAGAAFIASALKIDDALDTIRTGTGATGKELEDLGQVFRKVNRQVPNDIGDVAIAISDLNTRTGLTGDALGDMATQMLTLARLTKSDVVPLIAATTRLFGDWSIATEDQSRTLDYLFRVTQTTGIGLNRLTELVVQFGAPLRSLGFSFEQSAALMGKFEKEGVNLETVFSGLRFALGKFAKAGLEPAEAFRSVQAAIKGAGSEAEATGIAFKVFGQRAAVDMSRAIIEGRFEINELVSTLENSSETILSAAKETDGFAEKFKILKKNVMDALEPIGTRLLVAIEQMTPAFLSAADSVRKLAEWFAGLPQGVQTSAFAFVGLLAAIGPLVFTAGAVTKSVAGLMGVLKLAGPVLAATTTGFKVLFVAMGPIGWAILGATAAYAAWKSGLIDSLVSYPKVAYALTLIHGIFSGLPIAIALSNARMVAADQSARNTSKGMASLKDQIHAIIPPSRGAAAAVAQTGDAAGQAGGQVGGLGNAAKAATEKIKTAADVLKSLKDRMRDAVVTAQGYALRLREIGGLTNATAGFKEDLKRVLDDVVNQYGSLERAGLGAMQAIHRQVQDVIQGTKDLLHIIATIPKVPQLDFDKGLLPSKPLIPGSVLFGGAAFSIPLLMGKAEETVGPFRQAFTKFGNDLPGMIFSAISGGGSIIGSIASGLAVTFAKSFESTVSELMKTFPETWKEHLTNADKLMGLAGIGLSSAIAGFGMGQQLGKAKGALAGAGTGALTGAMIAGPVGAAVGGLAGLFGGIFGGASKAKKALAELRAEQGKFLQQMGGMANLQKTAEKLGVSIGNAFTTTNPKEFEAFVNRINSALEAQKQRWEGLEIAVQGVNARAASLASGFESLFSMKADLDPSEFDAKLAALVETGQAGFERLGRFAAATFAGMVRETGDAIGALQALAPALKVLQTGTEQWGLTGTKTIQSLVKMFKLVNDEGTKPLIESLQATGQIFQGLAQAGVLTAGLFQDVGADIGQTFRELEAKGADVATAMALSQPILQRLWEGQRQYGAITDETTARLLRQAEQQGLVGDHMRDVNEKILDVLIAIADVFGADIPNALRGLGPLVEETGRQFENSLGRMKAPELRVPIRFTSEGADVEFGGGGRFTVPAFARGGIVFGPTLGLVGEAGPEAIVPLSDFTSMKKQDPAVLRQLERIDASLRNLPRDNARAVRDALLVSLGTR